MGSLFQRKKDGKTLPKWWIKYREADGRIIRKGISKDKRLAQQALTEAEKLVALKKLGVKVEHAERGSKPLSKHIDDYEHHLRAQDDSDTYVRQTIRELKRVQAACSWAAVSDFSASQLERYLKGERNKGLSPRSSNCILGSVKRFVRWLVLDRRLLENPIGHLEAVNESTDIRRKRRALTAEEFAKLIHAAECDHGTIEAIPGRDRAILYLVACWTGLRRKELGSLRKSSFKLDASPPFVRTPAAYTKNKKQSELPLHPAILDRLAEWLETKDDVSFVLPVAKRNTAKMVRLDLWAAGIEYQTEDGFADFHAQRHTFISNLVKSGASPKEAQLLARHSDINLTMNCYTHLGIVDQAAAVERLLGPPEERKEKRAG